MPAADAALVGLFVVLWGSAFNAAKVVVAEWPPLWGLALRFAATAPLLLGLMLATGQRLPRGADLARVGLMGLLGTGGYLAFSWMAAARVPSGLVAIIAATVPLFVAFGEVALYRRRFAPQAWVGLLLGWAGVALLGSARVAGGLVAGEALGFVLALLGAASQAAGLLAFAPARGRVQLWAASFGQSAVSALLLFPLALLFEGGPPTDAAPVTLLGFAYSVVVIGVGGYALLFMMLRRFPPSTASALQLLAPPVAALIGWGLLGERLDWADVGGGAVTLFGLTLLLRAPRLEN